MSGTIRNVERYDPDLWTDEFAFSQPARPGARFKVDLFYDYRTNVDAYPKWQAWMREKQPRLLVSGVSMSSPSIPRSRKPIATTCRSAEVHVVDGGHFALDTAADEIAALVRAFVTSSGGELEVRRAG